jgi:hypothetical protein
MKIQKVFGKIWIGPGDDVKRICQKFLDPGSVDIGDLPIVRGPAAHAILNVADDYPEYPHHRDMLYIHAGLNDGPPDHDAPYGDPNSLYAYIHAVQSLRFLVEGPWDVFVHCHEGVSRSTFVVACYLSWLLQVPYEETIVMLRQLYPRANPHPKHPPFAAEIVKALEVI